MQTNEIIIWNGENSESEDLVETECDGSERSGMVKICTMYIGS